EASRTAGIDRTALRAARLHAARVRGIEAARAQGLEAAHAHRLDTARGLGREVAALGPAGLDAARVPRSLGAALEAAGPRAARVAGVDVAAPGELAGVGAARSGHEAAARTRRGAAWILRRDRAAQRIARSEAARVLGQLGAAPGGAGYRAAGMRRLEAAQLPRIGTARLPRIDAARMQRIDAARLQRIDAARSAGREDARIRAIGVALDSAAAAVRVGATGGRPGAAASIDARLPAGIGRVERPGAGHRARVRGGGGADEEIVRTTAE